MDKTECEGDNLWGQVSEEEVKPTLAETGVGCFLGKKHNGVEIRKLILVVQSLKFTQKRWPERIWI